MHLNQQLAAQLKHSANCKEVDPKIFLCTTTQYLLGQHIKISGDLCIIFVEF